MSKKGTGRLARIRAWMAAHPKTTNPYGFCYSCGVPLESKRYRSCSVCREAIGKASRASYYRQRQELLEARMSLKGKKDADSN